MTKSPTIPLITIDSNCVVGLFDRTSATATSVDELRNLMRYALSGLVRIAVTTKVEVDFSRDRNDERRNAMLEQLTMLPVFGSTSRFDESKLDDADVLIGPREQGIWSEIQRIVFHGLTENSSKSANKIADIDHLLGHKLAGRDVFVTDDRDILRRYSELRDGPGIIVMSPEQCLRYVDGHFARQEKRPLEPAGGLNTYSDTRLRGTVSFDYSNNDQHFVIGEGLNLFETQWSKASDTSIYALRDAPSIDSIALAKGAADIREVRDAAAYDFSSRHRTPRVGEIIVWRNVNLVHAATKILAIKDDTRGADSDELCFEFVILPGGSTDFS